MTVPLLFGFVAGCAFGGITVLLVMMNKNSKPIIREIEPPRFPLKGRKNGKG